MRYLSLFSGVEAATLAWEPLGWECVAVAEVAPFPSAVLAERWPGVPNLGDITQVDWSAYRGSVDLIVGGSPCQSFSVAGLRRGLDDPRGNLALEFLRAVDAVRPRWVVWENVPGVFSAVSHASPDPCPPPPPLDLGCDGAEVDTEDDYDAEEVHAFLTFLAALRQLGYGFSYRVLDAQYVRVESHLVPFPSDAGVCSLSDILESWDDPATRERFKTPSALGRYLRRYWLSARACLGILRRAARRERELPPRLREALESVANGSTPRRQRGSAP